MVEISSGSTAHLFQSTSSVRRTTQLGKLLKISPEISIHVLREEDDTLGMTVVLDQI